MRDGSCPEGQCGRTASEGRVGADGKPRPPVEAEGRMTRLADFLFEVGMLRKTPRTGYQYLGTGAENVAEHSFRTAIIGWTLAVQMGLEEGDASRVALMCLFHDLPEARCGDFNYVAKQYDKADHDRALDDALAGTGLEEIVAPLFHELEEAESLTARIAQDADQIDLVLNLKEQQDLGNPYAPKWIECATARLRTEAGRALAAEIAVRDHTDWWFLARDKSWWEKKNGRKG